MRNRQSGLGYLGFIGLALLAGLVVKVLAVAVSPYLDNYNMGRSVKAVMKENESSNISIADFKVALSTQFQVNNVENQTPGDLTIVKEGTVFTVTDDYEIRRPFIANVDVVFKFSDKYVSEETAGAQ